MGKPLQETVIRLSVCSLFVRKRRYTARFYYTYSFLQVNTFGDERLFYYTYISYFAVYSGVSAKSVESSGENYSVFCGITHIKAVICLVNIPKRSSLCQENA